MSAAVVLAIQEPSAAMLAASGLTPWFHFSGVMHPAVAHFPIALLIVAAVVESWSVLRRHGKPMQTTLVCLYLGATAAVVAAVLGLGNAAASGDRGATLDWHKWLGIGVAVVAVVVAALSVILVRRGSVRGRTRWAYRGGLFVTAALVGLVGSYGGKLVHGETYYADAYATLQQELAKQSMPAAQPTIAIAAPVMPATAPTTAPVEVAPTPAPITASLAKAAEVAMPPVATAAPDLGGGQIDYARDVAPIFLAHCVKCHNETKKKGGYRLDAREHVFGAGESGQVAVMPGRSDESLLIKLVEGKAEYADSIMPPKGDPLTFQQIALIRRWIDEGAK